MGSADKELSLGIDTGGTFTDAVLWDRSTQQVLASAKAFTTYEDLSIGILEAVRKVLATWNEPDLERISFVGLSTTLATNALVEGRGGRVGLILIGYDLELLQAFRLKDELGTKDFINVPGGHNEDGTERSPLNEEEARKGILQFIDKVDAFAVSGYFGVRNPEHELRVKALIQELASREGINIPVTCGHELTSRLDSVRRAMTTVMNARLIPLLQKLIHTVRSSLDSLRIHAPLMVVRGDGSLMRAEWAIQRPIETILSGPASSVMGAQILSGESTFWMVDVGGTTTDIAYVYEGIPRLNLEGARVGKWKTMVEAIDLRTIGLGGDSRVQPAPSRDVSVPFSIGPERVVPLSVLARRYPTVLDELRRQAERNPRSDLLGRLLLLRVSPLEVQNRRDLSDRELLLADQLRNGPRSLKTLSTHERLGYTLERNVRHLVSRGIAIEGGFTPTDALHVLGELSLGNREAALLGAHLQARLLGIDPEVLCRKVRAQVSYLISKELTLQSLRISSNEDSILSDQETILLDAALHGKSMQGSGSLPLFQCSFTLKDPIVAVGAPVKTYLPDVAKGLHTRLIVPTHAEVANAVGAVAGLVVERMRVEIRQFQQDGAFVYRAHSPLGVSDHTDLTECIRAITTPHSAYVRQKAIQAGAEQVEIHLERRDRFGSSQGNINDIYLETELQFTAMGRPSTVKRVR